MSHSLEIIRLVVGQQATNSYLVWETHSRQAVVFDPGDEATLITEEITRHNLELIGIYLTHGHFDHLLGVLELMLATGAPFYLHPADQFLLDRAQSTAKHFLGGEVDPVPPTALQISDGDVFSLGETSFSVIHTPGHTPGSVCFLSSIDQKKGETLTIDGAIQDEGQLLFCGDTILPGENTDLTHGYSSPKAWKASVSHLLTLDPYTLVLPGHGEILPLSFYNLKSRVSSAKS